MSSVPLPPLAGEDHVCDRCELSYGGITVEQATGTIATLADEVRAALAEIGPEVLRRRPRPETWSAVEYVCHLRDVHVTYTIRLHRTRTEDEPVLEPMLNDLRARRFRYQEADVQAVLAELDAGTRGFCDEVRRVGPDGWDRVATRQPGEVRSARWLVRQVMHEGVHHLADIRLVGGTADR